MVITCRDEFKQAEASRVRGQRPEATRDEMRQAEKDLQNQSPIQAKGSGGLGRFAEHSSEPGGPLPSPHTPRCKTSPKTV